MDYKKIEKFGSAGAVLSFALFTFAAILSKPEFVFLRNYLSELGREGTASLFFNTGLVLSAVFIALFFAALAKNGEKNLLSLAAGFAGVICATCLAAVAAYPIQTGSPHHLATYAFFLSASLAILLESAATLLNKFKLPILLGAAQVAASIALALHQTPVLQVLTIALFGAWMLVNAFSKGQFNSSK